MVREIKCDLCLSLIAHESAVRSIIIGEKQTAECCFNCASKIERSIELQKTQARQALSQPAQPEVAAGDGSDVVQEMQRRSKKSA